MPSDRKANRDAMKSPLTQIALRKAVGLYLGEDEVAVSKMASTPLGPIEIESFREPCTPQDMPAVMERLLLSLLGTKRRIPVSVGLPSSRVFFGTRLAPTSGVTSPESVLQKALCSANISVEDLTVDLMRSVVNKSAVASVVTCRKKYISGILANLNRLGIRPLRSEPAPCALLRLASQQHRSPRRSKMLMRVFLGATHGLAVLTAGDLPIGWRPFILAPGMECLAILSAGRTLRTQHRHYGIETPLDYVMIHGRADLHERMQQEQFASEIGTRVLWHDGPALDGAAMAHGLALGGLSQDVKAFDLSRSLKSRAPIKEIFPWGEMAIAAGLVGCLGVVLTAHSMKLDESYVMLRAQNAQHACLASADVAHLEKDKKAMTERLAATRSYLESRIQWTDYIRDLSERLPAHAELNIFNGRNPLNCGGKSKTERTFHLQGAAPLAKNGSIPHDIETFLHAIPRDRLWKRDFTSVVTDIRLPLSANKEVVDVDFTIECLGKIKEAPSSSKKRKKEVK